MRKIVGTAVAVGLALGGVGLASPSLSAAPGTVTVKKIATQKVKYGKSVVIKPSITAKGNVTFSSRKITVSKGKKTIAKNKTAVRLKAGTYKVVTTAKYRTWRVATRYVSQQDLAYPAGALVPATCTIVSVGTPESDVATTFDERCTGQFDGFQARSGSAAYDTTNQWWVLDNGSIVAGAKAKDLVGHVEARQVTAAKDLFMTTKVPESYVARSALIVKKRTQSLTVKQGKRPTSTIPDGWNCPAWAPIKGNQSSMIYHVPSGAFYDRTNPEICFSSEGAAKAAGYRKSKR